MCPTTQVTNEGVRLKLTDIIKTIVKLYFSLNVISIMTELAFVCTMFTRRHGGFERMSFGSEACRGRYLKYLKRYTKLFYTMFWHMFVKKRI